MPFYALQCPCLILQLDPTLRTAKTSGHNGASLNCGNVLTRNPSIVSNINSDTV